MEKELISVVIPLYNVEKFLDKCIDSVVNQTYKNLEIILVDDGSTDKCPQICDEWEKKDSRIKVLHIINSGVAYARTMGISAASGEYIGFVDSDDFIAKDMIEILYCTLKNADADISICNFQRVKEDGNILQFDSGIKDELINGQEALERITKSGDWNFIILWNKLYRRDIIKSVEFPKGKIYEDEFVAHQIFYACTTIACTSKKLYYYVERTGSITTGIVGVKCLDKVEAFCERMIFYNDHDIVVDKNEFAKRLKSIYYHQRMSLPKIKDKKEKKRVAEIDKLYKDTYFKFSSHVSYKEKIFYSFPKAWNLWQGIKNIQGKDSI